MKDAITVGIDMGDKTHSVCVIDAEGAVVRRERLANTATGLEKFFKPLAPCRVALEAGTHSGWVSRLLEDWGHEVLVGNPRKLRVIWDSPTKDDDRDAEMLGRIARFDPQLLHPIHHRSRQAHAHLEVIKARDKLVKARTVLIAHARGAVKATGERIGSCSPESFHRRLQEEAPGELHSALEPLRQSIEQLSLQIRHYDRQLEALCTEQYPEAHRLRAICGVGPITALAFILTLEDPSRFATSRSVGAFLGLTPRRDQSGETEKQLPISKAGNTYLRRLLVGSAQHLLGPFGTPCDLREKGLKLAERGGKNAKRRAVVAVARKLAVLMHHLWTSEAAYDPHYQQRREVRHAA